MESLQVAVKEKQVETRQQAIALKPILQLVIQKTKELKSEVSINIFTHLSFVKFRVAE